MVFPMVFSNPTIAIEWMVLWLTIDIDGFPMVLGKVKADMEFVQNFTPPDFQATNFTPSISPNFNSFGKKKHKKMSENG